MADTTLYKQIVLEWGQDTDSLIWGMGYSPDNGEHFYVLNTTYGRKYRTEDGDRIWPFIVDKVKAVLDWSNITNKPDLALKTDLTWSNVTGKPDVALKSDVAAVSAVASNASAKADSNAKLIADKASQEDLNNVSSTASSALDKATSNANALSSKVNKSDLTWTNITNRPDFDSIASQASQAVVTANTAESQASAAGQAAASASAQASAAKTTAETATATANAAKASASTASATAASAQQVAKSASASASATAVALKSKADTATVNAQFTAVNSSVASAQSTADSAVAGLDNKLDKTALTWGNIANKPTNLATTDSVAKAQSAANSAVSMADGAVTTANSAKSAATSAVGVANTANTTANSALSKANSAATVASQANSNANQAVTTANQAKSKLDGMKIGTRNLLHHSDTFDGWDKGNLVTITSDKYLNGTIAVLGNTGIVGGSQINTSLDGPYDNQPVTWTVYAKADNVGDKLHTELWGGGGYTDQPLTNNWQVYQFTGQRNTNNHSFYLWGYQGNKGSIYVALPFAVVGNMIGNWEPNPEDMQTQIDANKMAAANAQASASNAQNTANSALSKANSNATTLETKITKSDLTWANISGKPSIPDVDATTTVSSGDLNNYTITGKYYMPNALSNYTNHPTTGTDMGDWFVMKVDAYHGGDMIVQTIYQINSGDVWIRQRWSNSWKSWRQVTFWPHS